MGQSNGMQGSEDRPFGTTSQITDSMQATKKVSHSDLMDHPGKKQLAHLATVSVSVDKQLTLKNEASTPLLENDRSPNQMRRDHSALYTNVSSSNKDKVMLTFN